MFAAISETFTSFAQSLAPEVALTTIRDLRNLFSFNIKKTKSISRLLGTWGSGALMTTLFLTGSISLAGLETTMAKLTVAGAATVIAMAFSGKLAKAFHQIHIYRKSKNLDHNTYIAPEGNLPFTNSRLLVEREELTDVVTQFWEVFQDRLTQQGIVELEVLQQHFSDTVVPALLAEIIKKTELHDVAKNVLEGVRETPPNPAPFFEFWNKYLDRAETEAKIIEDLAANAAKLNAIATKSGKTGKSRRLKTNLCDVVCSQNIGDAAQRSLASAREQSRRLSEMPMPSRRLDTRPADIAPPPAELHHPPVTAQYFLRIRGNKLVTTATDQLVEVFTDDAQEEMRVSRLHRRSPSDIV